MIQIQCTRQTLDKFNIVPEDYFDTDNSCSWHANLFSLNGVRCLYLMNDLTFFGFVVYNVCDFEKQIKDEMRRAFVLAGESTDKTSEYLDNKCVFTKTSNRKIISRMNAMIKIVEYNYLRGDEDIDHINQMLWEYSKEPGGTVLAGRWGGK